MPMKLISSEYDQATGMTEEHWFDENTNRLTIRRLQDVEETLNINQRQFNDASQRHGDGIEQVARIPLVLIEKLQREKGLNWFRSTDKERRALLNDPDFKKLRTRPGRL